MSEKQNRPADRTGALPDDNKFTPREVPGEALGNLATVGEEVGGAWQPHPEDTGAIGYTHFDSVASEDNTVTVLLTRENLNHLPSQALVRIKSREDERTYLGTVVRGPFAEPDGLKADSPIVVVTTVQGKIFLPRYHGRAYVAILGEEFENQVIPPRFRPRPSSPVFVLSPEETAKALQLGGDARLGLVVAQEELVVSVPTQRMSVLPRHLGIIGTTGGGKSTTTAALTHQLQAANVAVVIIDVEGEYVEMDQPTTDERMLKALKQRGLSPGGVRDLRVYHLVERETNRETSGKTFPFCLRFANLSPYAVMEILEFSDAQQERFLKTFDTTKLILRDLRIYPSGSAEEQEALELDELDSGYPRMTLFQMIDVAGAFHDRFDAGAGGNGAKHAAVPELRLRSLEFHGKASAVWSRVMAERGAPGNMISWKGVLQRLWRVQRFRIFDNPKAQPLAYGDLIHPGRVSVIDLSDTDSPQVNNLVIADILRGIQREQEKRCKAAEKGEKAVTPVVILIEEAHEFLSAQRIKQMPVLFEQVARIARRGRKRRLGLAFSTQLPQRLPDEVLGLINNHIIHKISDPSVVDRLRRSIGGFDKSLWDIVPRLAPGQAVVSLASMTRPLLVSIDPTPTKLKLLE